MLNYNYYFVFQISRMAKINLISFSFNIISKYDTQVKYSDGIYDLAM